MKRLTANKIAQLHFALHYVLESDDLSNNERRLLEEQMELLHGMNRRLTGAEIHS